MACFFFFTDPKFVCSYFFLTTMAHITHYYDAFLIVSPNSHPINVDPTTNITWLHCHVHTDVFCFEWTNIWLAALVHKLFCISAWRLGVVSIGFLISVFFFFNGPYTNTTYLFTMVLLHGGVGAMANHFCLPSNRCVMWFACGA